MLELKVLFATDLEGDESEIQAGLQLATRLARERAATLVILHVVRIDQADGEANLYRAVDLMTDRPRRALERLVPSDLGVAFRHALEVGDPETRILELVERERVELLVLQARRRSALKQVLGRSLVERLMQRATCPVVSYHAEDLAPPLSAAGAVVRAPSPARLPSGPEALSRLLEARVNALRTWMQLQRQAAGNIAKQRSIRQAIASLSHNRSEGVLLYKVRSMLELELSEHQRALGALGVQVIAADGAHAYIQLGTRAQHEEAYADFIKRLQQRGAAVSLPLEGCLILAGAQVLGVKDAVYIVFALDARRDFLRILAQPGPTPSAETYAFDVHGLMLSNSRFPEQLQRMGLLPAEPGIQTLRRLRICDPGYNLLTRKPTSPSTSASTSPWTLTRMAAAATAGEDGCDWKGYRDYRGVEVIGAWRWLSEYGFGVAAEMDL